MSSRPISTDLVLLTVIVMRVPLGYSPNDDLTETGCEWSSAISAGSLTAFPESSPIRLSLSPIDTLANVQNGAISPDGRLFFFTHVIEEAGYTSYCTRYGDSGWSLAEKAMVGELAMGEVCFSPDGNYIMFRTVEWYENPRSIDADVWIANLDSTGWHGERRLPAPLNGSETNDAYATMTANGEFAYHSNRNGGIGGYDIYLSRYDSVSYAGVENPGVCVNSVDNEFHPCIAPDGSYLVFSSSGRTDSVGAMDLYVPFRKADGGWSDAVNLGPEVNSPEYDYAATLSADGKNMFFSSRRDDGQKGVGIWWVSTSVVEKYRVTGD